MAISNTATRLVSVVDDDESIREALPDLLKELGFSARTFASAEAFLASGFDSTTNCLLLDISMPGMSGPELQLELTRRERAIPIVFITARPDDTLRRQLLELGAIDFLIKPFTEQALKGALDKALGN